MTNRKETLIDEKYAHVIICIHISVLLNISIMY